MFKKLINAARRPRAGVDDVVAGPVTRRAPQEPIDVTSFSRPTPPAGAPAGQGPPSRVVPDTLVPGGILGPGGPAGIPTIPAVTMPPVDWTEPILAGNWIVWRLRTDRSRLRRAGEAGAESEHHGDPLVETGMAHLYSGLRSTLTFVLRSDPELLGADHCRRSWELELERHEAELALATGRLQPIVQEARPVEARSEDPDEQRRWTAARNAEAELRGHEDRVREATQHLAEAQQYGDIAGRRALERLDLVARAGIDRLNLYRTAFNRQRTTRPGLDPLPDDLPEQLIRATVQPILDNDDDPPEDEPEGDGDRGTPDPGPGDLSGAAEASSVMAS